MRWRRELDGGREQELEAGGSTWLEGGDRKTYVEKMADTSVWLVRICERYGGRPDKRDQEAPESGAWEQERGGWEAPKGSGVEESCFRMGPAGCSEGQLDGLHTGWYSWRGRNVGK